MIKLLKKIPKDIYVAVSGGVDSMAVLDFLRRKHSVTVLHFNHNTPNSLNAETFIKKFCETNNISINIGQINSEKPKGESPEEYWRKQRYDFFSQYTDKPIITAHHLDDVLEWWLFSVINGCIPKLIKYERGNIIRPFLITEKNDLIEWCRRKGIPHEEDKSNNDIRYARNRIRKNIIPEILSLNSGVKKTLKKKIIERERNE